MVKKISTEKMVIISLFYLIQSTPFTPHMIQWLGLAGAGWVRSKLRAVNSIQVSHTGGKDSSTQATVCCPPGHVSSGSRNQEWAQ